MLSIKDVIAYLKDNPRGYWFKRKLYGWGWVPAKWQGWAVIGIFIFFFAMNGLSFSAKPIPSDSEVLWFLIKTAIYVAALIAICYMKGESPRWQWGLPKKDSPDNDTNAEK